jgi:hypothetical protein
MTHVRRVFILGAGFSKPAQMPLATELLPLLLEQVQLDEMRPWLDNLRERLAWLFEREGQADSFALNIEQVFHYAHFDIEVHRLRQQRAAVGRGDGPGTPWHQAESIGAWLSYLEYALADVILACEEKANLATIDRWAAAVGERDAVLTFNYDTLVERALTELPKSWSYGIENDGNNEIPVFKLHGSIDWIVAHHCKPPCKLDLLFEKQNVNRSLRDTGHVEDDYCLWRRPTREQSSQWIKGRDLQMVSDGVAPPSVGIAGLGAYKELHRIPGLGVVWARAMRALHQAELAVVVGFSMSDFDAMAQMQFAEVARSRRSEGRPLPVIVIDPLTDEDAEGRFRRVFRLVEFIKKHHETVNWTSLV